MPTERTARTIATIAIVLILLLLMALAGGQDKADAAGFTPRAQTYYTEAIAYWARPIPCADVDLQMVPLAELQTEGEGTLGYTDGCRIRISETVETIGTPCEERELVFHEVGHLVGLEHTTDPTSYMTPDNGWQMCREWRAAWRAKHHVVRGRTITAPRIHRSFPDA